MGSALVRVGVRQHARPESISKRAPSTVATAKSIGARLTSCSVVRDRCSAIGGARGHLRRAGWRRRNRRERGVIGFDVQGRARRLYWSVDVDGWLGRRAVVPMVEAADLRCCDDATDRRRHDRSRDR
jgi:hypothetical protein